MRRACPRDRSSLSRDFRGSAAPGRSRRLAGAGRTPQRSPSRRGWAPAVASLVGVERFAAEPRLESRGQLDGMAQLLQEAAGRLGGADVALDQRMEVAAVGRDEERPAPGLRRKEAALALRHRLPLHVPRDLHPAPPVLHGAGARMHLLHRGGRLVLREALPQAPSGLVGNGRRSRRPWRSTMAACWWTTPRPV